MRKMLLTISGFVLLSVLMIACDSTNEPQTPNNQELIIGTWKVDSAVYISGGEKYVEKGYDLERTYFAFYEDGVFKDNYETGSYSFGIGDSTISITFKWDGEYYMEIYKIVSLNEDKLVLTDEYLDDEEEEEEVGTYTYYLTRKQ